MPYDESAAMAFSFPNETARLFARNFRFDANPARTTLKNVSSSAPAPLEASLLTGSVKKSREILVMDNIAESTEGGGQKFPYDFSGYVIRNICRDDIFTCLELEFLRCYIADIGGNDGERTRCYFFLECFVQTRDKSLVFLDCEHLFRHQQEFAGKGSFPRTDLEYRLSFSCLERARHPARRPPRARTKAGTPPS